jgi:hypothetical protein
MPRFEKGRAKTGGRKKGVGNKPKPFEIVMANLEQAVKDRAELAHDDLHAQDLLDRLAAAMYRYRNYVVIHNDPKYRRRDRNGVLFPKVRM